jgi:hypothetical protein
VPTEPLSLRLLDELVAACGRVTGASFHYDLLAAIRVRKGYFLPNSPPTDGTCVSVALLPSVTRWGAETFTGRSRTMQYRIQGWAQAAADTPEARQAAAARLEQDLLQGLDAEHQDSTSELYKVSVLEVQGDAMDGAEAGLSRSCGYVVLMITATVHLELGEVA